jgi:hypothetical protein
MARIQIEAIIPAIKRYERDSRRSVRKLSQEIERLRLENSKLREQWLEASVALLSYTGLPRHLHRLDVKMKEHKALPARAADALEKASSDTDTQLVEELRKAAE